MKHSSLDILTITRKKFTNVNIKNVLILNIIGNHHIYSRYYKYYNINYEWLSYIIKA